MRSKGVNYDRRFFPNPRLTFSNLFVSQTLLLNMRPLEAAVMSFVGVSLPPLLSPARRLNSTSRKANNLSTIASKVK